MAQNMLLKKIMPHFIAVLIFLIAPTIYFLPQIQGKILQPGDIISAQAYGAELKEFRESTGEKSWWTNSIFGGMPAYQIEAGQPSNMLKYLEKVNQLFISRPIGYFFGLSLSFYAMLIFMGVGPRISIIGALCFTFSTGNMLLLGAGHMAKLRVFAFFGLIVLGMLMVFKKQHWKGAIVFATGLGLNLYGNHVQMTYFFFLILSIYGIFEIIESAKAGRLPALAKSIGFLLIALILGVASSSSKLWSTYEYGQDTMRGNPILVTNNAAEAKSSSETKGLEWKYAMSWSNGLMDLAAAVIPGVVGGSGGERLGSKSALYQDLKKRGANLGREFRAPLYWGALPSTGGPFYMGAIVCFLFVLGLILVKGKLKWWLGLSMLLLFLFSMGGNLSFFNKLFFDYFPLFNKFRTPNSLLSIAGFVAPILGMVALSDIVKNKLSKEEVLKGLKISLGIVGGFCLFFAVIGPSVIDFSHVQDARLEQGGYNLDALFADRAGLMRSDSFRSFILIALTAALIWAFVKNKIKAEIMIIAIGIMALGDLWLVDKRYMTDSDFVSKSQKTANLKPRPADLQILKDKDPHYRVFDISKDPFNDAFGAYFHKMVSGYHAAKLQRISDIIDRYLSKGDQKVLGMLNTKYIINREQKVQSLPSAMGNAWFVSKVRSVNTPLEEIESIKTIDPKQEAVVLKEFDSYISGLNPSGAGTINLTKYAPNKLNYQSNNSGEGLAVFSEVWYGPDKGWNAYIDGELVEHIRADYFLRALKIPSGQHNIEFKFEPSTMFYGEKISLFSSLLILCSFLGLIVYQLKDLSNQPVVESVSEKNTAATVSKPKSKRKKK